MGSRGYAIESGGFVQYNYHTIMRKDNIRFVVQHVAGSVKLPEISNSPNVVYVTLGKKGQIKSVSFYNNGRRRYKEIDIDHSHEKMQPHVHTCDPKTSLRDKKIPIRLMTAREKSRLAKIIGFYSKNGLKEKAIKSYKEIKK